MPSNRIGRINEEIQRELAALIRTVKDPRVHGLVSVTAVDTTPDLRYAKIYVSVLDKSDVKEVVKGLKSAGGYLRRELGRALSLRYTPELQFVEDSGRGYRRVVPSPRPVTIVERDSILNLLDNEYIVIACGGGGIPVIKNENGDYTGVPAVIDKDFASAKLAELVDAEYLFILTAVDHVAVNFGRPDQMQLTEMTVDQAREYCSQGQFAAGSMLPKVQAAMAFAESKKGRNAVIASLEKAPLAMVGKSGTRIYQG